MGRRNVYADAMTCPKCENIVEKPELIHVLRHCEACGREMRIHEPGDHGIGVKVRPGDKVSIPAGWMTLSLNPLKSRGQFSRYGVQWMASQIYLDDLPQKKDEMLVELNRLEKRCDEVLTPSKLLGGLNLENPEHTDRIVEILKANRDSLEWWTFLSGTFSSIVRDAIESNDARQAVWAMACAERCRSMSIFKEHLEEVVFMGQSAKRLIDILHTWDANKQNADEGFWQITFTQNVYAINQLFAVPLVFIKDSAYVGGMNINRQNAKLVDYLLSMESSREAVLVEIKTPVTKLLGRKYRGTYTPSTDLMGAVAQVLDYRVTLVRNLGSVGEGVAEKLSAYAPRCVVIAGNGSELDSPEKRRAFEQFRANSKDVEVVTYDELFRKLEVLANLFSLTRAEKKAV